MNIDDATEPVLGRAVERRRLAPVPEHIRDIVPSAAPDEPSRHCFVGAPFPDIATHVIHAVGGDGRMAAHTLGPFSLEVALRSEELRKTLAGDKLSQASPRKSEMAAGGQALACEFGISLRLVPTDSRDRVIVLALRVIATLPGRGSWPTGAVDESGHGLVPAELFPILDEFILPALLFPVPPLVHELLILPVRDFIAVDEEILDLDVLFILSPIDPDHAGGDLSGLVELPQDLAGQEFIIF